jgi:hypothetical protein
MSRNNFWRNFWGETGRNSGKWASNKVFGDKGWATPRRHIFSNDTARIEKENKKTLDDLSESQNRPQNSPPTTIIKKNVATNEHDVKIAEIERKSLSETIDRDNKESKFFIWTIVGIFVGMLTFIIIIHNYTNSSRIEDEEQHLKLENTEFQINLLLKEGKKVEASALIFELNHPSEKPMLTNPSVKEWLNGQETYNNYWIKKRTYYIGLVNK